MPRIKIEYYENGAIKSIQASGIFLSFKGTLDSIPEPKKMKQTIKTLQ